MKKLILSLIAVSGLALTTQAQTEKGNWTAGGAVSLETYKTSGLPKSNTSWKAEPTIGYFVARNIEVGIDGGYIYNKFYRYDIGPADGQITTAVKNTGLIISPYARVFKDLNDQFKLFGQLSVPITSVSDKTDYGNIGSFLKTGSNNAVGVTVSPGFAFFPNKRFGVEFSVNGISYNNSRYKDANGDQTTRTKEFSISGNFFAPRIGVRFYF